jgi:hypothetical protein
VPRRHLVLSVTLMTAALAVTSTLGQQRGTLQALAEKVCHLGKTAEKDWLFEQLGLNAPLLVVVEPMQSGIAVSVSTCSNMLPRADTPFLGIHHLVEATAPGESVFMDYFTISSSGELIAGVRRNLTAKALIRLDITEPEQREQVRDLESYWLNKYGLQSR